VLTQCAAQPVYGLDLLAQALAIGSDDFLAMRSDGMNIQLGRREEQAG